MIRHFVTTCSFEDESPTIDASLHIVRGKVFTKFVMSEEEESKWGEQIEHALAYYNLIMDGVDGESDEEDSRHIDIEETKKEREVQVQDLHIPYVAKPLKLKKVKIGME